MMMTEIQGRKLWRIPEKGMIKGVCAGIAQYFDIPVKLVRIITVLAFFFGLAFFVLVGYIVLTFLLDPMPADEQWQSSAPGSRELLNIVDTELHSGEQRLRAMERYVTSDTFQLRSNFREL